MPSTTAKAHLFVAPSKQKNKGTAWHIRKTIAATAIICMFSIVCIPKAFRWSNELHTRKPHKELFYRSFEAIGCLFVKKKHHSFVTKWKCDTCQILFLGVSAEKIGKMTRQKSPQATDDTFQNQSTQKLMQISLIAKAFWHLWLKWCNSRHVQCSTLPREWTRTWTRIETLNMQTPASDMLISPFVITMSQKWKCWFHYKLCTTTIDTQLGVPFFSFFAQHLCVSPFWWFQCGLQQANDAPRHSHTYAQFLAFNDFKKCTTDSNKKCIWKHASLLRNWWFHSCADLISNCLPWRWPQTDLCLWQTNLDSWPTKASATICSVPCFATRSMGLSSFVDLLAVLTNVRIFW